MAWNDVLQGGGGQYQPIAGVAAQQQNPVPPGLINSVAGQGGPGAQNGPFNLGGALTDDQQSQLLQALQAARAGGGLPNIGSVAGAAGPASLGGTLAGIAQGGTLANNAAASQDWRNTLGGIAQGGTAPVGLSQLQGGQQSGAPNIGSVTGQLAGSAGTPVGGADLSNLFAQPAGYKKGGIVHKTGVALVHEGELVVPKHMVQQFMQWRREQESAKRPMSSYPAKSGSNAMDSVGDMLEDDE